MKYIGQSVATFLLVMLLSGYSCGQTGPTPNSVSLSWTQCVPPPNKTVTLNNVYRCATASCTPAPPAIYTSTAAIVAYVDTTVLQATNYTYTVTCTDSDSVESGYSNQVSPPPIPQFTPPVQNPAKSAELTKPDKMPKMLVAKLVYTP
jgi:hypothetical protein